MKRRFHSVFWPLLIVVLLVIADEWFKFIGLQRLPVEGSLVDPGVLALAIHENYGIAFNIPIPMPIVIVVSVLIALSLVHVAYTHWYQDSLISFASLAIVVGALGNLFDRIVYGFTVDYLILFGRSAINLSDLVILSGVVLLLYRSHRPNVLRESSHPAPTEIDPTL